MAKKIIVKRLYVRSYYYDGFKVSFRSGNVCGLLCEPKTLEPSIEGYDKVELVIYKLNDKTGVYESSLLGDVINDPEIDRKHTYRSSFDNHKVLPYVNQDLLRELGGIVRSKFKQTQESTDETIDVPETVEDRCYNARCRACNDVDPYGFIEPDGVVDDGNYTCWECSRHPFRWSRGLKTEEHRTAFSKKYK